MTTRLQRRWGETYENPSEKELRQALSDLATDDAEHPDCWLSDDEGWSIAAHQGGSVVLENIATSEGPWHLPKLSSDEVLGLWQLLQNGQIERIRQRQWIEGYN